MEQICAVMLLCGVFAPATALAQTPITLDLAGDRTVTMSVEPQTLSFVVVNRLPNRQYTVMVSTDVIAIPAFEGVEFQARISESAGCPDLSGLTAELASASSELGIGSVTQKLREALGSTTCDDLKLVLLANSLLARTSRAIEGIYAVSRGTRVTVTITRDTEKWQFVLDGGSAGEWLTTYGTILLPSRDQAFFSRAAGESKFVITPERELDDTEFKVVPSVFFTWLDRKFSNSFLAPVVSAGMGLKENAPAIYVGGGVLNRWNLHLSAGVTISRQQRLRGQYSEGQEIAENLTTEQLNRGVLRPSWSLVVAYRFGENPFTESGGEEESNGGSATPNIKPAEKAAAKPKPF